MDRSISRRDFLKVAGFMPLSLASLPLAGPSRLPQVLGQQNVLVLVFDAFSAYNMSLYGYARQTTPNIDRLAGRAIVYRNHHAGGNFTTPGTASILTAVYPWTHRAVRFGGRTVPRFHNRNAFSVFDDYYRFAYTHNSWVQTVLRPMAAQLDDLLQVASLYTEHAPRFVNAVLDADEDAATVAWSRATGLGDDGYAYSLYLSRLLEARKNLAGLAEIRRRFPRGMPGVGEVSTFTLETAVDWLVASAEAVPEPYFSYVHLLPPHAPYRTRFDFVDRFWHDGYVGPPKPTDRFASEVYRDVDLERQQYDEFILYVDAEFGRLFEALESSGALQNTWVVLTSDHGELFERGLEAHASHTLYEPEIRVPLLIFEPGRTEGVQVDTPTSAVDLLPTLAHVTAHEIPTWTEGALLPPFGLPGVAGERAVCSMMLENNHPQGPLHEGTAAIIKGSYKLQRYFGYERLADQELVQLFDIVNDPEELNDLSSVHRSTARELLTELKALQAAADEPYRT